MKSIMVRYRVKKDKLDIVRKTIIEFVDNIRKKEPGTLLYEAYEEPDPQNFVHFMTFKDEKSEQNHRTTPHVKKFVDILYPNCEIQPMFTNINLIKSTKLK